MYYNNTAGGHALDCKESAQTTTSVTDADPVKTAQMLYIYGNANDIDITSQACPGATSTSTGVPCQNGAQNVKIAVSGITNPYAKFTSFGWTVQT